MKLIVAIIQDQDSHALTKAFNEHNIRATKLSSTGGFLRTGNTTLIIGTKANKIEKILDLIEKHAKRREQEAPPISPLGGSVEDFLPGHRPQIGGATVFVLPIEGFYRP